MGKKQNLARLLESKKTNVGNHAFSEIKELQNTEQHMTFFSKFKLNCL